MVVTSSLVWAKCYSMMAAALAAALPEKTPHFFVHPCTIAKAARNFEGTEWASYDSVVCRQAANKGSLDWGSVDNSTYSEAFSSPCAHTVLGTHSSQ